MHIRTSSILVFSRQLNLNTGVFLCQFFLSRLKKGINAVISTITSKFQKDSYFYIVSRQEETRFQLVSKHLKKSIKKSLSKNNHLN